MYIHSSVLNNFNEPKKPDSDHSKIEEKEERETDHSLCSEKEDKV